MTRSSNIREPKALTDVLAIDCGLIFTEDNDNRISRCSVANLYGYVVLDVYVEPEYRVKNYTTRSSGITRKLNNRARDSGETWTLELLQDTLVDMFRGRVVAGHDAVNYLDAVEFDYATHVYDIDAQSYTNRGKQTRLRYLLVNFGVSVQDGKGGHSSVEDARGVMLLYWTKSKWFDQEGFPHYSYKKYVWSLPGSFQRSLFHSSNIVELYSGIGVVTVEVKFKFNM